MSSQVGASVRKTIIALGLSILYGAISVSLDPEYADFITEQDFGDIRPAIFFPAIIAILYGPWVGAITAGFGNLIYDGFTNLFLDPEGELAIDNLVGFVGNFVGAFIVGIFANPYRNAGEIFDLTHEETNTLSNYFNMEFVRRLLRNTLASMIGMGLVTGLIIGYGLRLEPGFVNEVSFIIFTAIAYWNGLFLLLAIPILYSVMSLLDYYQEVKEEEDLIKRRTININTPGHYPFNFVRATSPPGDELWSFQWGAIEFVIKNKADITQKFAVRIASNDIFSPHRHTTPDLEPGEEDSLYFNVYGISSGDKESTIFVKVGDQIKEYELNFHYEMGSSTKLIFNKIMGILLIVAFGMSTVLILLNIRDNFVLDNATILAIAALPVEIILVLIFYLVWNNRATNVFFQSMGLRREIEEVKLMSDVVDEKDSDTLVKNINRKRLLSTIFLVLTMIFFIVISVIVVIDQNNRESDFLGVQSISNDYVMIIIAILLFLFLISDLYLGSANRTERRILDQKELSTKVIRSAATDRTPEIFAPTKIYLRIFNPFETRGIRIFFHSIDNITPREFILDDTPPKELVTLEMYYTPLQDGRRDIGVEVVQFTDENDQIIPVEKAVTFDQEMINLNVSSARVLGLNQSQIGILRGLVAGIGSVTIAITFISQLLNFTIDQQFLETTLPLLIILQSPVIWLTLSLQDRIKKRLNAGT